MPVFTHSATLLGFLVVYLISTCYQCHAAACKVTKGVALCDTQMFSDVPDNLPMDIEEISLNNNQVKRLQSNSLSRFFQLQAFSCANSGLESIQPDAFRNSRHLQTLNLAENNLNPTDFQTGQSLLVLSQLKVLDLSGNRITEDMASQLLKNLTSLERLSLSRNLLFRLDSSVFSDLHQLKELNLDRNMLYEIDGAFESLKNIQRLNLAFNFLSCLVNFESTQLVALNASHNNIEWFISNQDLTETFQLETLDLSDNKLLFFPFLPTHSKLRVLLLSQNKISFYDRLPSSGGTSNLTSKVSFYNIPGNVSNVTAELWDETLHGDLSSVELLDVSGNLIVNFPQGFLKQMPHLYQLKLRTNCMESLNLTSEDLPNTLFELDVSNNKLSELHSAQSSVSELNNLTHLNLSLNDIRRLPPKLFSTLPRLSSVDLSYNEIGICDQNKPSSSFRDCVDLKGMASLRQLRLVGCNMEDLPPSAFEGSPLTHLELSNNVWLNLKAGSLSGMSGSLQHLGLGNTGTRNFDFTSFYHLTSLNISANSISQLPQSLLELKLKVLDLSHNYLSAIPTEQASRLAQTLEFIYLSRNHFNCCHLDWYREFKSRVTIVDIEELRCSDQTQRTHSIANFDTALCDDGEESILWYIVLIGAVVLTILSMSVFVLLILQPTVVPTVIKKKYLKATSY